MAEARGHVPDPQTFGNPETGHFWREAAHGRFVIKRCTACGKHHWYPRSHCPHCGGGETEWVDASGGGTIYSFTILRRGGGKVPAYVTLDEGISVFTNIVDCDPERLSIGQRVTVRFWAEEDGLVVPVFAPES
ncbi:OB-fold domain-containing protein [Aquamicrobium sp. LC103]|uniref:Zn-ribbon domain-containing OB-fold protein n=1 Tax=Aquamicrobium sp. LC103 TaxID=1120658 RepID=UPI00063E8F8A|nr:OB-fold domain-containing protein [Aquamicrobium sp. LC103]TKT74784.1 DNA-binding protein [Aquamicrobium sp. LC103]